MKIFVILGLVALVGMVAADTECIKRKNIEAKNTGATKLDIQCLPNGNFAALQCYPSTKACFCMSPNGTQVTAPSKTTEFCACTFDKIMLEKELRASKSTVPKSGRWVPKCEPNGSYHKKQCESGTDLCWCVNQFGMKISKDKKKEITC